MERSKTRKQKTRHRLGTTVAVAILLTVAGFAMATPAEAATQELKITDWNLYALQNLGKWIPYSSGELLEWAFGPTILDANYQYKRMVGTISTITVADNNGNWLGECVSLGKSLSKNNVATNSWVRGDSVMKSYYTPIAPGTVIAKFNADGTYDSLGGTGHVAIFRGYYYNNIGQRIGILVWDQNYVSPYVVGRHVIMAAGLGVNNANNYYTVRVKI